MTEVFNLANAGASVVLIAMIGYKLLTDHHSFRPMGRWGAGVTAGALVMAAAAWAHPGSPFDGWAAVVMRFGFALILIDWFGWVEGRRGT